MYAVHPGKLLLTDRQTTCPLDSGNAISVDVLFLISIYDMTYCFLSISLNLSRNFFDAMSQRGKQSEYQMKTRDSSRINVNSKQGKMMKVTKLFSICMWLELGEWTEIYILTKPSWGLFQGYMDRIIKDLRKKNTYTVIWSTLLMQAISTFWNKLPRRCFL